MYYPTTYNAAVGLCILTMFCWGSWANTTRLVKNWRFELFYWDYVWGILLASLVFALTLGNTGSGGRGFLMDLNQALPENIQSAIWGGMLFNLANILLGSAISLAGMSVAFPVGIGLALALGVVVNYVHQPEGNPLFIWLGVGLIVIAILLSAASYRQIPNTPKSVSSKGIILALIAGILMGFFYKFVAASMFTDFQFPVAGKLSPYTASFLFSVGILISNPILNTLLMRFPVDGNAVTYASYFQGTWKAHGAGLLGGAIWCTGMTFSLIASSQAGFAISYGLGQGATLVAAAWGVFVWKEFKTAPTKVNLWLTLMFICYLSGLISLIFSK